MPGIIIPKLGCLDFVGDYKPGDPKPDGYCDRQEWAEVQMKAGLKAQQCCHCCLWKFPQELSGDVVETVVWDRRGRQRTLRGVVCKACKERAGAV